MTSSVHQAREALGQRLRDIRRDARLTGRELATVAGWHSSKVSKIEYGKQTPSEEDIRVWCRHTGTETQVPDLVVFALYRKVFEELTKQAVIGHAARALITAALARRREENPHTGP